MKLTHFVFQPSYDSQEALYVNGILYKFGDDYHNKIRHFIDGYATACVEHLNAKYKRIDFGDDEKDEDYVIDWQSSVEDMEAYIALKAYK